MEVRTPVLRQFQNVECTGLLCGLQPHPPPPAPAHPLHFSRATLLKVATSIQWSEPEAGRLWLVLPPLSPLLSSRTAIPSPSPLHLRFPFLPSPQLSFQPSFLSADLLPIHPHCWEALTTTTTKVEYYSAIKRTNSETCFNLTWTDLEHMLSEIDQTQKTSIA